MSRLVLKEELRPLLQEPLGELISGPEDAVVKRIKEIIRQQKPPCIISVGDNVSRLFSRNNVKTDLRIIDNREMRQPAEPYDFKVAHTFRVSNPAGVIEDMVWPAIVDALKKKGSLIIVEGEEDLLTLVVATQSLVGSLIFYGQPRRGVVALTVDQGMKNKISSILKSMERVC